tara:strand:+ start:214 stop:468 length:255 start_codon:yes stop_codon:yes gene_type:complete
MSERCIIHLLDADDLERSIDSPALASLMSEGWTIMANLVVETPQGNRVALLLSPPKLAKSNKNLILSIVLSIALQTAALVWILQ